MTFSRKSAAAAIAAAVLLSAGTAVVANAALPEAAPAHSQATTAPVKDVIPSKDSYISQNRISVGASAEIVRTAMESCQGQKLPFVTVAVVDRFGTVQALLRGDNAAEHTIEAAQQKAYTAAAFGAPTSELAKRITGNGPSIADLPGTLFLAGGVPLKVNGVSVAGVGVGGAPDGTLDEKCAVAGASALAKYSK